MKGNESNKDEVHTHHQPSTTSTTLVGQHLVHHSLVKDLFAEERETLDVGGNNLEGSDLTSLPSTKGGNFPMTKLNPPIAVKCIRKVDDEIFIELLQRQGLRLPEDCLHGSFLGPGFWTRLEDVEEGERGGVTTDVPSLRKNSRFMGISSLEMTW